MKGISLVLLASALVAGGAMAAEKHRSPKEACFAAVQDVKKMYEVRDIGEKASTEVQQLIEISEHLCEQGNFAYSENLTQLARSMLATE